MPPTPILPTGSTLRRVVTQQHYTQAHRPRLDQLELGGVFGVEVRPGPATARIRRSGSHPARRFPAPLSAAPEHPLSLAPACLISSCPAALTRRAVVLLRYSVSRESANVARCPFRGFHIPSNWRETDWITLSDRLAKDLAQHAKRKTISTSQGHTIEYDEIKALHTKPIIDEIDRVLARHYGFRDEELDFIINYDIKYRMGQGADVDEEDA
jgi:hypothetical protein